MALSISPVEANTAQMERELNEDVYLNFPRSPKTYSIVSKFDHSGVGRGSVKRYSEENRDTPAQHQKS